MMKTPFTLTPRKNYFESNLPDHLSIPFILGGRCGVGNKTLV